MLASYLEFQELVRGGGVDLFGASNPIITPSLLRVRHRDGEMSTYMKNQFTTYSVFK